MAKSVKVSEKLKWKSSGGSSTGKVAKWLTSPRMTKAWYAHLTILLSYGGPASA